MLVLKQRKPALETRERRRPLVRVGKSKQKSVCVMYARESLICTREKMHAI